ncbi:MAG: agmatine deiminase family protein [Ilumatobacteraceae bacterium]
MTAGQASRPRMPAESAPHERTVMCWPTRAELYGDLLDDARDAHATIARTIAAYEPVTMIAHPDDIAAAIAACHVGTGDDSADRVEVVALPIDDSWFRDTGPIYVVDTATGARAATDWVFNGWGGKYSPFGDDAAVARRWAEHAGHDVRSVPMVLEGGAVTVDGEGTLVTTTQCLLHPNRNPSLTRTGIETTLRTELGTSMVHWLPFGLADDADTDGHVDNVAAFAEPGVLLVQGCDAPAEPDHDRLAANRRWIDGAPDASGRPIEVVELPILPFAEIGGRRIPVPYLNFYVGNGFVVVPVCGHPADGDMCGIIAERFPHRDVVALDVGAVLAHGGGGIHCITQQVPAVPSAARLDDRPATVTRRRRAGVRGCDEGL